MNIEIKFDNFDEVFNVDQFSSSFFKNTGTDGRAVSDVNSEPIEIRFCPEHTMETGSTTYYNGAFEAQMDTTTTVGFTVTIYKSDDTGSILQEIVVTEGQIVGWSQDMSAQGNERIMQTIRVAVGTMAINGVQYRNRYLRA